MPGPPSFEAIDLLDGFCTLERRSATLDGNIPLRAAQGCVPFLEGNSFGWQIALKERIGLRRGPSGWEAGLFREREELERRLKERLPAARDQGLVVGAWSKRLEADLLASGASAVTLFTGLLVRPAPGVRLRLSGTKNRHSLFFSVREAIIDDPSGWVPLVLECDPHGDRMSFVGDLATLAPLPADVQFRRVDIDEAPEVVDSHLAFFDQAYYDTKKTRITRKYRTEKCPVAATAQEPVRATVVQIAPNGGGLTDGGPTRYYRPLGPVDAQRAACDRLSYRSEIAFRARFDNHQVGIMVDEAAMAALANPTVARWHAALDRSTLPVAAITRDYFRPLTAHRPGDPHFFAMPGALFSSSPGSAMLVEGTAGPGWEVLRAVVNTDVFHACPAVFELGTQPIAVAAGTLLLELFPISRSLAEADFVLRS